MRKIFIAMFALLALFSCESDDGDSSSEVKVEAGTIRVVLQADGFMFDGTETFMVNCNGVDYPFSEGETTFYIPDLDYPAVYELHIYNVDAGYTCKVMERKLIATNDKNSDGVSVATSTPMYYSRAYATLSDDTGVSVSPSVKPMTGTVSITLVATSEVSSVESVVSGVVTSWNCTDNKAYDTTDNEVCTTFTSALISSFQIFGVNETLDQEMDYYFNSDKTLNGVIDFSDVVSDFNNDKTVIYSSSYDTEVPVITYEQGTLVDREEGDSVSGTIN